MSDKPTDEEMKEFWRGLADGAHSDQIPKMRASFMCLSVLDGTVDVKLALEIGLALLLDKPLVIVAVGKQVKLSRRLRQIADAVIEGENFDAAMKAKASAAIEKLVRRHREGSFE
jgi:hypothetical protein